MQDEDEVIECKNTKRALRRHHEDRMRAKAGCIASDIQGYDKESDGFQFLIKNRNNITNCSCQMCRNPRRNYWKEQTRKEKDTSWKKEFDSLATK